MTERFRNWGRADMKIIFLISSHLMFFPINVDLPVYYVCTD